MTTGPCPLCGGRLQTDRRRDTTLLTCSACGAGVLDATTLAKLLPAADGLAPPAPREHGYPVHYPQQDAGHGAGRLRPTFAPGWAGRRTVPSADAAGLLRGRF